MYSYSQLWSCIEHISARTKLDERDIANFIIEFANERDATELSQIVLNIIDAISPNAKTRRDAYLLVVGDESDDVVRKLDALTPKERFASFDSYSEELASLRERAVMSIKTMGVNVTGARPGETIVGIRNISQGAIMRISEGSSTVPASKDDLDAIRLFPELWAMFIGKLRAVEFFSTLTDSEMTSWLKRNERSGDFDMAEVEGVHVVVEDVGKSTFSGIESEKLDAILSNDVTDLHEIREAFPKKPGSRARRHTLIFFLHWWRISRDVVTSTNFTGTTYDFSTLEVRSEGSPGSGEETMLFELNGKKIGIANAKSPLNSAGMYFDLLLERFTDFSEDDVRNVRDACRNFTPAGFKSLLQKLIRYAPLTVRIQDEEVSSEFVVCCVFTFLLTSPGSFVPDIQRFVSGQESAFKRLMISILEDSYLEDETERKGSKLLLFAMVAFLSQRVKSWKPSKDMYFIALDACEAAIRDPRYYDWMGRNAVTSTARRFSENSSQLENLAIILEDIRSFESDIAMANTIAERNGRFLTAEPFSRPKSMKIEHCIDQHWAPEIAYFLPTELVEKYGVKGSKPFSEIFIRVFRNVTGVNSRKSKSHDIDAEFVKAIKETQRLVLLAKQSDGVPFVELSPPKGYTVRATLDISWIAGMVGVLDAKGKPPAIVTMRPEDPYQFVALRKPARGMKDGTLSDERSEDAIQKIRTVLSEKGVALKSSASPIEGMNKYTMFLSDGEFLFKRGTEVKTWDELSHVEEKIRVLEAVDLEFQNAVTYRGKGIQTNGFKSFRKFLEGYDVGAKRRALSYISSNRGEIEIARLSKDGGGTLQAVTLDDVAACQILLIASLLFPSALERVAMYSSKFRVKLFPLMWKIRDVLREATVDGTHEEEKWPKFKDVSGREARSYQNDSVNEMIEKHEQQKKGHFLWMTVGLGKTFCALSYLRYLNRRGELPKYVVWALPKSALASVIKEIEYFEGLKINLLLPVQSWKKHPQVEYVIKHDELVPYAMNIIEHDHLRKLEERLIDQAPNTIFVIDEVHKAMNDTKRTNVALEISRLSNDFIALTGTPIVDSNTYKLIWWLEQLVEFEVNEKNFWVAANGMIAKKVNTGVAVDRAEVAATFTTNSEAEEYRSLVPAGIGGTNPRASQKDIAKAFELCYKVADREMIDLTMKFLKDRVMLVARNSKHQQKLAEMLVKRGVNSNEIFLLTKNESIFLTDESVDSGETEDYKVAIVPQSKSEGYTLTRMRTMITSVYPSNQATREQLEGRINRLSQRSPVVHYRTVHVGILTYVLEKHRNAASLSALLSALADEV